MKTNIICRLMIIIITLGLTGCATWNKTQKGAAIGTATGGATGAIIGKAAGNTALGAIIGAAVGGATGIVIGRQMDKQAEDIKKMVPEAKVERIGEGVVVEFNNNILFSFDNYELSPDARTHLDKLATVLTNYSETNIEVQGHTDDKGSELYNQKLSEKRAASVADYLRNKGVQASRISTKGFGEKLPKYLNDSDENRSKNRRVEFVVTANEKMKQEAEKQAIKN